MSYKQLSADFGRYIKCCDAQLNYMFYFCL